MEEMIKAWLQGAKNYAAGVALLKTYGQDQELLQFFLKGCTPFRQQRLQETLAALASGKVQTSAETAVVTIDLSPPVRPESIKDDPKQLELHRQKVILHREKDELRAALEDFETDQERGEAAFRILEIRQIITGIWEIEVYYKEHGRFPENSAHIITDLSNLKHHRSRINGNLRRIRSQLKKDPGNPIKKQLLTKWQAEYEQIQQSIKQHKSKV